MVLLNYKYFRCRVCNKPFKRRTRSYAWYCKPCRKKVKSQRIMEKRARDNPNIKLGVGSGGNQKGKNNPYWKGGASIYRKTYLEHNPGLYCERCGSTKHIVIHHRDEDRTNSSLENLEKLCRSCHKIEHDRLAKLKRLPK